MIVLHVGARALLTKLQLEFSEKLGAAMKQVKIDDIAPVLAASASPLAAASSSLVGGLTFEPDLFIAIHTAAVAFASVLPSPSLPKIPSLPGTVLYSILLYRNSELMIALLCLRGDSFFAFASIAWHVQSPSEQLSERVAEAMQGAHD